MALINQFQTYSQKENAVTNNILLMLSRLYQISPRYSEDYLAAITDDSEGCKVIPSFAQQVGNHGNGIIDGFIHLPASKVIIETKLSSLEIKAKLLKYTDSFEAGKHKVLLHLSSHVYSSAEEQEIIDELKKVTKGTPIYFYSRTFEEFAIQLEQLSGKNPYDLNLRELSTDFRGYCESNGLIAQDRYMLRAMACGQSFDVNVKYQFYFDDANKGYSSFSYLGIYAQKCVQYIGEVENTIVANYTAKEGLEVIASDHRVTEEQRARLGAAIDESVCNGWRIEVGQPFFLLKDFHQTDFKKISPGGIFRVRYFNLKEVLKDVHVGTKEIAEELREKTWV